MGVLRGSLVKAVSFDVMNTLLHLRVTPGQMYGSLLAELNVGSGNVDQMNVVFANKFRKYNRKWPCYRPDPDAAPVKSIFQLEKDPSRVWWYQVVAETIEESVFDVKPETLTRHLPTIAREAFDRFGEPEHWQLARHSMRALNILQRNNIKMAIISNFDERLIKLLRDFELYEYFEPEAILLSAEIGLAKPDPRIFEFAVRQLKLDDPQELMHVGDSLHKDCVGAENAGCQAVQYLGEHDCEYDENYNEHGFRTLASMNDIDRVLTSNPVF